MIQDFKFKINNVTPNEKKFREESLNFFNKNGFPNKRLEEWKFTDFNQIVLDNFKELKSNYSVDTKKTIEPIKDFEHNYIVLINGLLKSINFKFEKEKYIKIQDYNESLIKNIKTNNSLINLNNALNQGGYYLEVLKNYKLNKPLVIYNYFLNDLTNQVINNKNLVKLDNNCKIDLIEFNFDISESNFIQNNYTTIKIGENSILKNYTVQGCGSRGIYYKYIKSNLGKKSIYENHIFSSGLKFNKIEEDVCINGENAECKIQSALFLNQDEHQEIKTNLTHNAPNSKSYQKIKNVLNENCKGVYQGKIFVKNIAQKTDAYQLSKALLIKDSSEFNAKPELEIYADDVKCSHGSTSGSVNEDSIYYLMTRGITRKEAVKLLTKAFLYEILDFIADPKIKKLIEKNLDRQIYGH
jgi:Fe-S cluster assembly protein SufD